VSAPLLFLSFANLNYFHLVLYFVVFAIGALVGLELPLLMRILKEDLDFKDLISRVLTVDYVGALVAAILFPIFLVPRLGLVRTSLVFGMLNGAVGLWGTWVLQSSIRGNVRRLCVSALQLSLYPAGIGVLKAERLTTLAEDELFADDIIPMRASPYQRLVITRGRAGFQLFLNGNLNSAQLTSIAITKHWSIPL
jgi:spermidine synthase